MGADLIVMTTHGHSNIEQFFISHVAERVIRKAGSSVLLIRPTEEWHSRRTRFQRLFVGLDGSRSEILLLGVLEADFEEEELRKYLESVAQALQKRNLKARTMLTGSGTARTIGAVSESEDADLVILAKNGRGGSHRRLRSAVWPTD